MMVTVATAAAAAAAAEDDDEQYDVSMKIKNSSESNKIQ